MMEAGMATRQSRLHRGSEVLANVVLAILMASVLGAVLPQASFAAKRHHRPRTGLFISGPQENVILNTEYTYKVEVVTPHSYIDSGKYKGAALVFSSLAAHCQLYTYMNLVAYKPWKTSYTIAFTSTNGMPAHAMDIQLFAMKTQQLLYYKSFSVAPALVQPMPLPPYVEPCPNQFFGS
jgi:hypothetical protein